MASKDSSKVKTTAGAAADRLLVGRRGRDQLGMRGSGAGRNNQGDHCDYENEEDAPRASF